MQGKRLPELPQPTHDFPGAPASRELIMDLGSEGNPITAKPIRSMNGTAAHPCVTIESALDDLPRFDW